MGIKSKAQIWPTNSPITIHKKENDILLYKETDEKGHVQTNKKTWRAFKATVIIGTIHEVDNSLEVPEGVLIWTCEIGSRGRLSALKDGRIAYGNEKVTVLVHIKD